MPVTPSSDRVALGFLALSVNDFAYSIFRKELTPNEVAVPGTRTLPRKIGEFTSGPRNHSDWSRHAVALSAVEGYERVTASAWIDAGLTLDVLHGALLARCQSDDFPGETEYKDGQFTKRIAFVLRRYEDGVRDVVWVRAYALRVIGRFGFLIDFALRVPHEAKITDKRRLELSLTQKNGKVNEDFYLDRYAKLEEFLHRYYRSIQTLALHDGSMVEIEGKLSVIRSFSLSKRVYVFGGNKEGRSPFFGIKSNGPMKSGRSDTRLVFCFTARDRAKSQDLYRALRGETYSTFTGMEEMFRIPFGKSNVSGIEITGFTNREIQTVCSALRAQFPTQQIIPIVLAPMSKHSSDAETRAYFAAKHAFLSQGFSSQFVDRKRLDDRSSLRWSISNIGLGLFAKMGGIPWQLKPSTASCLVVGIGQAHTVVDYKTERYFAYSVLTDSSGIYESIRLLGNSKSPDEYYASLKNNLREVLLAHRDKYTSFVLHLTFSMKRREIEAIKDLLRELKQGESANNEFIALKFSDRNDFFGFSVEHNSRIPYEGIVAPLSRKEFLMWFSGLGTEDSKAPKKPERPVHVQVLYPEEPLSEIDLRRVLQDSMNIAGANWRGFNAKSTPISVYYAKLIAQYYAHFREANLPEVNLETLSPWFL
jgi:Piwi domain